MSPSLRFPPFHITPDVDLLYRGDEVVPLEPHAVRVLRYLAENHARVVSKEELLEHVWPDVFTTDGVLKKAVSRARRALNDDADNARFIETYHARGYRFIAPVTLLGEAEAQRETSDDAQDGFAPLASVELNPSQSATAAVSPGRASVIQLAMTNDPDYDQLIGREAEVSALAGEYRRTLKGTGSPVLITADPGGGKTQLARHFARWARKQGAHCIYARFFDYGGSRLAPYEVFLDLLRAAFSSAPANTREWREGEDLFDLRAAAQERCGISLPQELFTDASAPYGTTQAQSGAGTSTGDPFRAVVPISKCFVRLSRANPLALVLDDIQWADEASRDVLGYLMRTASNESLMLIMLARSEEANDSSHPLAQWLKHQANYRSYTSLALRPLEEGACRLAIETIFGGNSVLAPDVPANDVRTLCHVTGGNPYFLIEMLRLLVAEGAITQASAAEQEQQPSRWQWHGLRDLRLPDTIVMAARAKLDRLSEEVREIAGQAAVLGDQFRIRTLAIMADKEEEEIERLLSEGVRRGVLSERGLSADEDCRFYHTILRSVLYDALPLRKRRKLHARAASAIEVVYAHEADRVSEALSAHYAEAGDSRRMFEWSMRAWQVASGRWHWSEALTSIERAQNAARELERQGEMMDADQLKLLLGLGEAYYSVGRLKESESVLNEAVALAQSLNEQSQLASALLLQGQTCNSFSKYREAQAPTEQALKIYRKLKDENGTAQALLQLGSVQFAMGNYELSSELIEQALEIVNPQSYVAAVAFGKLGWSRVLQGRFIEGVPLLERALDYHTSAGDVRQRAVLLRCLNYAAYGMGQYEKSITLAERARKESRSIGDAHGEAKSNFRIGQSRVAQGLYAEGTELLTRTLESIKVIGDAHCEAETLWMLGRAHCETGSNSQALELLSRSLEMIRSIGDRDDEFRILVDIARLKLNLNEDKDSLRVAESAIEIAEELHNLDGLGLAQVERSRACRRLRQPRRALEAAESAVKLLDETVSGAGWRGYWSLALAIGNDNQSSKERSLAALNRAVELLDEMREQLDPSDAERRTGFTRAHSGPARDLHAMLLRLGQVFEAKMIAKKWQLDEAEAKRLSR